MADLSPGEIRVRDMSFTAELRLQDGRPLSFMRRDGKSEPLEGSFMIAKKDGDPARVYFKWLDDEKRPGYSLIERSMPNEVRLGVRLVDAGVGLYNYQGWFFQVYFEFPQSEGEGEGCWPRTYKDFTEDEYDVFLRSVGRWTFLEPGSMAELGDGYQWMKADDKAPGSKIGVLSKEELQKLAERWDRKNKRFCKWVSGYSEGSNSNGDSDDGGLNLKLSNLTGMRMVMCFESECGLDSKKFEGMEFGAADDKLSESEEALRVVVLSTLSKLDAGNLSFLRRSYEAVVPRVASSFQRYEPACRLKMKIVERKILL